MAVPIQSYTHTMPYSIIITKRPATVICREYYAAKCGEHHSVAMDEDDSLEDGTEYTCTFYLPEGRLSIFYMPGRWFWGSLWRGGDSSDETVECELSANSEL